MVMMGDQELEDVASDPIIETFKCKVCGTKWLSAEDEAECCNYECSECGETWSDSESAEYCCICGDCGSKTCGYCDNCGNSKCCCHCCSTCGETYCECCGNCGNAPGDCYCDDPDDEIDEGEYSPSEVAIAQKYGLNPAHNLPQLCADYYLLQNMWQVHKYGKAWSKLTEMANWLAPELATYFDLAVGGELRYAAVEGRPDLQLDGEVHPGRLSSRKRPRSVAWDEWGTWKEPSDRVAYAKYLFFYSHIRDEATDEWKYDGNKLQLWRSGIGGPSWGDIASTLLDYLEGKVSRVGFIDRAWNLQHNGGVALNKIYHKSEALSPVLLAHGNDDYDTLLKFASKEVIEMWEICDRWVSRFFKEHNKETQYQLQSEAFVAFKTEKEMKLMGVSTMAEVENLSNRYEKEDKEYLLKQVEEADNYHDKQRADYIYRSYGTGDYTPPIRKGVKYGQEKEKTVKRTKG